MRSHQLTWLPRGRRDWTGALMMLVIAIGSFVILRLAAPGLALPVAALLAAVLAVALVRGPGLVSSRSRRPS